MSRATLTTLISLPKMNNYKIVIIKRECCLKSKQDLDEDAETREKVENEVHYYLEVQ